VEGPACEYRKSKGLFNKKGLAESCILDPTADAAVDYAVSSAHESTVDCTEGECLD
jgi:hypothetical protein